MLSYDRRINKRISVGGGANYFIIRSRCSGGSCERSIEHIVLPFAKFEYRYKVKPEFELYSSIQIPFIHLTALGFRKGNKHAFFGELGIGFGQLVSAGYSIKF